MRILTREEVKEFKGERVTFDSYGIDELRRFLESGAEYAELDTFNYSSSYAANRYFSYCRRYDEFRGKVAVMYTKYKIIARRL